MTRLRKMMLEELERRNYSEATIRCSLFARVTIEVQEKLLVLRLRARQAVTCEPNQAVWGPRKVTTLCHKIASHSPSNRMTAPDCGPGSQWAPRKQSLLFAVSESHLCHVGGNG